MRTVLFGILVAVVGVLSADNGPESDIGDIIYPTPNAVWTVGEQVNVTFKKTDKKDTISIFFSNDRLHQLRGGALNQRVFPFTVRKEAISPPNGTSLLLAVRRESNYLQSVDAVNVKVISAPSESATASASPSPSSN